MGDQRLSLGATAVTPVYGKLGDLYGRKRILRDPELDALLHRLAFELAGEHPVLSG